MTTPASPDICRIPAFAEMCGVPIEEAAEWVRNGTVPSIEMDGQRVVNMVRFRADLLSGKSTFAEGDYRHE